MVVESASGGTVSHAIPPLRNYLHPVQSMAMPLTRRWTTADVRALMREDRAWPRYELIDDELLVTPAPRGPHQLVVAELLVLLYAYLESAPAGFVLMSPSDLELRPGTITQPDVFVVPFGAAPHVETGDWSDIKALPLAVEVLSPSSLRTDRVVKRDFYLANGVAEYWIVDLEARVVERWKPAQETPVLHFTSLEWRPRDHAPLIIDLVALFDRIEHKWSRRAR